MGEVGRQTFSSTLNEKGVSFSERYNSQLEDISNGVKGSGAEISLVGLGIGHAQGHTVTNNIFSLRMPWSENYIDEGWVQFLGNGNDKSD